MLKWEDVKRKKKWISFFRTEVRIKFSETMGMFIIGGFEKFGGAFFADYR